MFSIQDKQTKQTKHNTDN